MADAIGRSLGMETWLDEVKRMSKRQVCVKNARFSRLQLLLQLLNFAMIIFSALMIWKGLMVVTGSESPIVVVLR